MHTAAAMGRLGTESAFEVLGRATRLQATGRDVINLGIGQPDFLTPPHIVEAGRKALKDGHHGYTPAEGVAPLREAVAAEVQARRGVEVAPDQVLIVPGGKMTMAFAITMFGEPGAEILYPDPGFPIYRSMITFTGATPVPLPLVEARGFAIEPEAILERITAKTRLLILNSPANPTGGVLPKADLDRLAAGLADHPGVAILSDEIYSRIVDDAAGCISLLAYPALRDRLILLDGWSKTYAMTGWRIGYGVWPRTLIDGAVRLAVNFNSCVNAATQQAAIAALEGPQDAVDAMVAAFARRRSLIVDGLNRLPGVCCQTPGGAFYAFPNVEATGFRARDLQDRLLEEAGVATIAGTSFGVHGEGYLRFSYAASEAAIEKALGRIREWLEGATATKVS